MEFTRPGATTVVIAQPRSVATSSFSCRATAALLTSARECVPHNARVGLSAMLVCGPDESAD